MSFESIIFTIDSGLQDILKFLVDNIIAQPKSNSEMNIISHNQDTLMLDDETARWIVAQQHSWDCGLACLTMLLKWQQKKYSHVYSSPYVARGRPLWTIDIFLLLNKEDVFIEMFTTSLGVQPHHHDFDWYSRFLADDVNRVNAGFLEAAEKDYPVFKRSLSLENIKSIINRQQCTAIVLVNSIILRDKVASTNYVGHYIMVIDYIIDKNQFVYLDPARANEARLIVAELFDSARRHPGTDEDIIFCYKQKPGGISSISSV